MKETRPLIALNMLCVDRNGYECNSQICTYAERVHAAGGIPLMLPVIEDPALMDEYLALARGVVLIGGPDYPAAFFGEEPVPEAGLDRLRPEFDLIFGRKVLAGNLPVLGVCAGCQLLAIAAGGKLIQHLPNADTHHRGGKFHTSTLIRDGAFARTLGLKPGGEFTVNSYHHQAVAPGIEEHGFAVTARAFDGTIEVIEQGNADGIGGRMVMGVQFHPERMDDFGPLLFGALVEAARRG